MTRTASERRAHERRTRGPVNPESWRPSSQRREFRTAREVLEVREQPVVRPPILTCGGCGSAIPDRVASDFVRKWAQLPPDELRAFVRCGPCLDAERRSTLVCATCGEPLTVTRSLRVKSLVTIGKLAPDTKPKCRACFLEAR
jgi:hypothetical protein